MMVDSDFTNDASLSFRDVLFDCDLDVVKWSW